MDPLTVFPPEIIHQIWRHLEPADLLAARAVAPHWLASISDCPGAWVTDFSHDWTEFLAVKKAVRGWSSKKVRKQTVRNVRDCVFTEFAYYLLYANGDLEMFSPRGDSVRTFHRPATDLHRGSKCLLIGVDDFVKSSNSEQVVRHHTIITDFVLNHIDDLFDTKITASSANGYAFVQDGQTFFSLGSEIPAPHKVPYTVDAQFTFLSSCAVGVYGFTVKTVQFFDAETESFADLKTSRSSPRWIPSVEILPGPDDYFSIVVEQRDFHTLSVYRRNILLYENGFDSLKCFFTRDYFIKSIDNYFKVYRLKDFKCYHLWFDLPLFFNIKTIICEPWSLVNDNLIVVFIGSGGLLADSDSQPWTFYRLVDMPSKSLSAIKSVDGDLKLEPKLQFLAESSTGERSDSNLSVSRFEFCPGYAFKIKRPGSDSSGNERIIKLLHFDI